MGVVHDMTQPVVTVTLADFLLARIAEDEAAVHDATSWMEFDEPWRLYTADSYSLIGMALTRAQAECEAKRRIVGAHKPRGVQGQHLWTCATCDHAPVPWENYLTWPCPTMAALASVYADHPDFRPEWRA